MKNQFENLIETKTRVIFSHSSVFIRMNRRDKAKTIDTIEETEYIFVYTGPSNCSTFQQCRHSDLIIWCHCVNVESIDLTLEQRKKTSYPKKSADIQ